MWGGEHVGQTYSDINDFEEECVPDEVLGQHDGTTDAGKVPFVPVGVVHVEPRDGDGDDVVGGAGDGALDDDLVVLVQYGRHGMGRVEVRGVYALCLLFCMSRGMFSVW